MTPTEMMAVCKDAVSEAIKDTPDSAFNGEDAEETFDNLTARIVLGLSRRNVVLVDRTAYEHMKEQSGLTPKPQAG